LFLLAEAKSTLKKQKLNSYNSLKQFVEQHRNQFSPYLSSQIDFMRKKQFNRDFESQECLSHFLKRKTCLLAKVL